MKAKPTYTTKLHAYRLSLMLKRDEPCGCCPSAPKLNGSNRSDEPWKGHPNPCHICKRFVGITDLSCQCPCFLLGKDKAIERSHKALREYYKKGE